MSTFLPQAQLVAARNNFTLLGCITTTSRCCWEAYIVSIDEFSHPSASCEDIDLCEDSTISQHAE